MCRASHETTGATTLLPLRSVSASAHPVIMNCSRNGRPSLAGAFRRIFFVYISSIWETPASMPGRDSAAAQAAPVPTSPCVDAIFAKISGDLRPRVLTDLVTPPRGYCPAQRSPLGNVCNRLLPCDSGENLRRFPFRQHDPHLPVSGTEEAFAGASYRPVTNVC